MRESKFNYIIQQGNKSVFYNGLTEYFFEVPVEREEIYREIIHKPSQYIEKFGQFINRMLENGFIISDETDEEILLEEKFQRTFANELYHIMILPTYQCNLRCWYCVQEHKSLWLSDKHINEIKQLLYNRITDDTITTVRLSWFGGEPLLNFKVIVDVTSYAKELAEKVGKIFTCDITTNGTLLNRKRIEKLNDCGVTTYQITIDGDKSMHDSVKVLHNGSAYDKSLENINIISERRNCILRFNYTHENLSPESIIEDLKSKIIKENLHNIKFLLYKVWQEPKELIMENDVKHLVDLSCKMGLNPILPTSTLCYADRKNFDCIFPNGKVEKCDNEPPHSAKGEIVNGEIKWNGNTEAHVPAFMNSSFPCRKCRYVPICWGPCVAKRSYLLKTGKTQKCCYGDEKVEEMNRLILNKCDNIKRSSWFN